MENVIECHGLVKRFGKVVALNGLTLEVPRKHIFGLIGPNGAGKTTTIRTCLLGLLLLAPRGTSALWRRVGRRPRT